MRFRHIRKLNVARWLAGWGVLCLVGGVVLTAFWVPAMSEEARSADWPVVRGNVIRTTIVVGADGPEERLIAYRWHADGRTRVMLEVEKLPTTDLGRVMREDHYHYKPGSVALIHVNPENPSEAWARRDPVSREQGLLAALLLGIGVLSLAGAWSLKRSEKEGGEFVKLPTGSQRWEIAIA